MDRHVGDPQLNALVDSALARNLDVREAQARLREARANRDAAVGRAFPDFRVTGSVAEQQLSANGQLPVANIPGFSREFSLFDLGFDASWEIDFWGRTRRSVEAANARGRQAEARLEDVRLQMVAETVRSYADFRSAQARSALLREDQRIRAEISELVDKRYRAGEASRLEAEQARQRASAAAAVLPEADASAAAALYRLGLLTGQPPEAVTAELSAVAPLPEAPALVAAGVRSEMLLRRPDVRAAEAELAAATADIGVAAADLYPRFSLMGSMGQQARDAGDLFNSASTRFSIGPSLSWPIFDFGRVRAQIRAADARADAAAARYEKAVLSALADSEAAANRFAGTIAMRADRGQALARAREAERLAELRFRRGEDDRLQLLEARSGRVAAAQQELAAKTDVLAAFTALTKALAGAIPEKGAEN